MKRRIVNSTLGRAALSLRGAIDRTYAALMDPSTAGTAANDYLAGYLLHRLCKGGTSFVDVGAHIGSVIAEVSHHSPGVRIVAVEAIPEKAAHLRRTFPRVDIHACALGEGSGETSFFVHTGKSGYSSLGRPSISGLVTEIKVPLRRLDDLLGDDTIDLIKMDVEGAELGVLRGSERIVAQHRPTFMFESGPQVDEGLGYTKEGLLRWFTDRDYTVLIPNRLAHDGPGLSLEGFLDSHLFPRRTTNYFAVASERRLEVRDRARLILGVEAG